MIRCIRVVSISGFAPDVFATLTDITKASKWRVSLREANWITPMPINIGSKFTEHMYTLGRHLDLTYIVTEFIPNRKMFSVCELSNFDISMKYEVEACGDSTQVTITLEANFSGALKLLEPMVSRVFNMELAPDLERLKNFIECQSAVAVVSA